MMQNELGNDDSLNQMFQVRKMDRRTRGQMIGLSTDLLCSS